MENIETRPIFLTFPPFFSEKNIDLDFLQSLNPDLLFAKKTENQLQIQERNPQDEEYFCLNIGQNFSEDELEVLQELNDELRLEANIKQLLIYKSMGGIIGTITAIVIASFITWAMSKKRGRVYSEDTDYKLPNPENDEEILWRKADVSFISYESVSEEKQKKFKKAITVPPDVAVEIVSARYGLRPALWKMQYFWLKVGVKLGIVICPFSKKIYVFEKDKHYEQSIYLPFTHQLLPNFVGDFSQYIDDIDH